MDKIEKRTKEIQAWGKSCEGFLSLNKCLTSKLDVSPKKGEPIQVELVELGIRIATNVLTHLKAKLPPFPFASCSSGILTLISPFCSTALAKEMTGPYENFKRQLSLILLEFLRVKVMNTAISDVAEELKVWQILMRVIPEDNDWVQQLLDKLSLRLKSSPEDPFLNFFSRGDIQSYPPILANLLDNHGAARSVEPSRSPFQISPFPHLSK